MMNTLDYYYLVLLRGFGRGVDYSATGMMAFTFTVNLFSLAILFDSNIIDQNVFWIAMFILYIAFQLILDAVYNKKRREKTIKKYKRESRESRQWGVAKVVFYELLSLALVIWVISMLAPR